MSPGQIGYLVLLIFFLVGGPIGIIAYVFRQSVLRQPPMRFPLREDLVQAGASEDVATLIADGRNIRAINTYREENGGLGLSKAKQAVDQLRIRARTRMFMADGVSERVARLVARGRIIQALLAYRAETRVSLREAREVIDTLRWGRRI